MPVIRTQISVSGFDAAEVRDGLADLLTELRRRSWLLWSHASWDGNRQRLVVNVHREGDDPVFSGEATFDEVWDCVIACISFASDGIHFDIDESVAIPAQPPLQ